MGGGRYGWEVGFGHACGRGTIDGSDYGSGSKTGCGDHVMGIGVWAWVGEKDLEMALTLTSTCALL